MKRTVVLLAVVLAVAIFGLLQAQTVQETATPPETESDGIFIHLTAGPEDPHRVLMALQMAAIMADSLDVLVYADIEGVHCFLKDSPDLTYSHFPPLHTQIKALIEHQVPVMVCPGCLKAAGKSPEDLMAGIQVANKAGFFQFTDGRILTLDY